MRQEIKAIIKQLNAVRDKVASYQTRAEDRENEDRAEELSNELELIEQAIDNLSEID